MNGNPRNSGSMHYAARYMLAASSAVGFNRRAATTMRKPGSARPDNGRKGIYQWRGEKELEVSGRGVAVNATTPPVENAATAKRAPRVHAEQRNPLLPRDGDEVMRWLNAGRMPIYNASGEVTEWTR